MDLYLNEAKINWFSFRSNYDAVVTDAADEAGGHGFVTEFAGRIDGRIDESSPRARWGFFERPPTSSLRAQRRRWHEVMGVEYGHPTDFLAAAADALRGLDGVRDVVEAYLKLPDDESIDDFLRCPDCYEERVIAPGDECPQCANPDHEWVVIDVDELRAAFDEEVAKPAFDAIELIESRPYLTRLYTTMSAAEMTEDPVFDFNTDLPDVSNVHIATVVRECDDRDPAEAPFRVELPGGGTIRGQQWGQWPLEQWDDLPATRTVMQQTTRGEGTVMVDNTAVIQQFLQRAVEPDRSPSPSSGDGGQGNEDGGVARAPRPEGDSLSCGCRVGPAPEPPLGGWSGLLLLGLVVTRLWRRGRRNSNPWTAQ